LVDIWLPYGRTEVCLRIATESFLGTIEPNETRGADNPREEIQRSLKEPVRTRPLLETVKPGDRISIALKGAEDPSSDLALLESAVKELNEAGARNEDITVLRGIDPLRMDASKTTTQSLSVDSLKGVTILDHTGEPEDSVYVGQTSFGTKVYINRKFVESKIKILAGVVEPHLYEGYSGGRDCVLPGISGLETLQHNLSLALDPEAVPGLLERNPVHEDMTEAARLSGTDFTLNIVRNHRKEIVKAFSGDLEGAFLEAAKFADGIYKVPVDRRVDMVFVSPGGFPYDVNLYEACKGIGNALEVVRKNGVIILVAECSEGYGETDFHDSMANLKDLKRIENSLRKRFTAGGYIAYSLSRALERVEVILVSTLPDYYAFEVFRLRTAKTVNEALRQGSATRKNAKVLVVLNSNITIPVLRQRE